jgi:hypothetical protein
MAIYHASMKVFVRSKGQTATGAAAYRAGLSLVDERTGLAHDYTRRGGVVHAETFTPEDAPAWANDPAALWNAAEKAEARKDARVARELEVSLPSELNDEQRAALASSLARLLVARYGTAVLMAIHAPGKGDARNHHVHLLMPTRVMNANGLGAKIRVLDDPRTGPTEVRALRAAVADITNRHLACAGLAERVDHRTLKAQADDAADRGDYARAVVLTRQPTVHLGRSLTALRRRGGAVGPDLNGAIHAENGIMFSDYLWRAARAGENTKPPVAAVPRYPSASRRSTGPNSVPRVTGQGPGARVLASQARQLRKRQRDEERGHRRFAAMLERVRLDLAEADRQTLLAYGRALRLTVRDMEALVAHVRRDRACLVVLRRALDARQAVERARSDVDQQRQAHGEAMVRTARARAESERLDLQPTPSRVRFLSRRQWADKRRHQRHALAEAEAGERQEGGERLGATQAALRQAEKAVASVEAARRAAYPLLRDGVQMVEKIRKTKSADVEPRLAPPMSNPSRSVRAVPRW